MTQAIKKIKVDKRDAAKAIKSITENDRFWHEHCMEGAEEWTPEKERAIDQAHVDSVMEDFYVREYRNGVWFGFAIGVVFAAVIVIISLQ